MAHIDLYRVFGLNPGQSSRVLDQQLAHLLLATGPADAQRRTQIDIARAILGDPGRRGVYDRQLADPAAQPITHAVLQQIAATPTAAPPQYPSPSVPAPLPQQWTSPPGDPQPAAKQKGSPRRPILIGVGALIAVIAVVVALAATGGGDDSKSTASKPSDTTLGQQPGDVEIDTDEAGRNKILRNSVDFQYLSTPKRIMPGAMYAIERANGDVGFCSFGWMARLPSDRQHVYNITAGHCGDRGDKVYLPVNGQQDRSSFVPIGVFVVQSFDEKTAETGDDYAVIRFDPGVTQYIDASPNITALGDSTIELVGVMASDQLAKSKPYMCHLGFRSGLSCGPFREMTTSTNVVFESITDHGDSGGVVWAFDPDDPSMTKIYAAAIVSWVEFATDAAATNGKTIAGLLAATGLQLVK